MEYILGLSSQGRIFLFSLGFGFLLGFVYDVFCSVRQFAPGSAKLAVAADTVCFVLSAVLTFFFLLVVDFGRIRLYSASGEIVGWVLHYFTAGRLWRRASGAFLAAVGRIIALIFKPFILIFGKIKKSIKKLSVFLKKSSKKSIKNKNLSCKTQCL